MNRAFASKKQARKARENVEKLGQISDYRTFASKNQARKVTENAER